MKKLVFILLCLALTLFAAGCVDEKKQDDHNSEQSTEDNLISSLPDMLPDKENGEIDGKDDAKYGGNVDNKGRSAYDEHSNDGYDGNFGGAQNGVTDGGIMDGGLVGSPDYMP